MPRRAYLVPLALVAAVCIVRAVEAHFQVLVPSRDVVETPDDPTVRFDIRFTHPMTDGPVMEMGEPKRFGVLVGGKTRDLTTLLRSRQVDGKKAFWAEVKLDEPGDCVFFVEPAPYWEPAEKKHIIHYTKVVVDAFGGGEGWDALVGLPVEIQPLVRPYGVWTGNAFRGVVLKDGKPVPFATVEVEYLNAGKRVKLPNDAFSTQLIKADAQGAFSYTMPRAGWWGFAALIDGDETMPGPDGAQADVELGALIWVKTVDMAD